MREIGRLGAAAAMAATAVAALCVPADAQGRPDTRAMSCAAINDLVGQYGEVVMTTGQFTYERFVAGPAFCDPWENIKPKYASAADTPRCVVQFVCRRRNFTVFD